MIIGYARVSTDEQKLDLQMQALESAGCERIFTDHGQSGADFSRDGLEAALEALCPGDTLVVWRLDRLGRSLAGLVGLMDDLGAREVDFRSVMENIDTASSGGRLMFHMMAALAEFERSLISERTRAGMAAAKAKGKHIGRPKLLTDHQVDEAARAIRSGRDSIDGVAARLDVSARTISRRVNEWFEGAADG